MYFPIFIMRPMSLLVCKLLYVQQNRTTSNAAVPVLFIPAAAAAMKGKRKWSRVYVYKRV